VREFVNPHYRNGQGLPELGITNAEEITNLANKISKFLAAENDVRYLLAKTEPEVVKSFRVIIDIFKSLAATDLSTRRFGGNLSAEDKNLINQHLSREMIDRINDVYQNFFELNDHGDSVVKDIANVRTHYQDVIFPLRDAISEAEKRILDYFLFIGTTSEEMNNEASKEGGEPD